LEKCLGLL